VLVRIRGALGLVIQETINDVMVRVRVRANPKDITVITKCKTGF
jgi:hypothetical protein